MTSQVTGAPAVNKAAERLLELADRNTIDGPFAQLLEAALATEREAAAAPALDAGPHWGNDGGMTDLIEKARDFRYSDEWIGNAFRAAVEAIEEQAAAAPALDVDRLAEAIANVWPAPDLEGEVNSTHRLQAAQIAAEYQRLFEKAP